MNNHIFPRMHVSLNISDLVKSIAFYTSFFHQEPSKVKSDYVKFELSEPSLIISFIENPGKLNSGWTFRISGRNQRRTEQSPKSETLWSLEKWAQLAAMPSKDKFWMSDPDGYHWEVYYFHKDAAFNDQDKNVETLKLAVTLKQKRNRN